MAAAKTIHGTRGQILAHVKRHGRVTVEDLAHALGVQRTTVHHHLARLEREGLVVTEEERRGPGRPRMVCRLTEAAEEFFPTRYRWLAEELLATLSIVHGPQKVKELIERLGERLIARYQGRVEGKDLEERFAEVAKILTELGFEAELAKIDAAYVLCDQNCPVYEFAKRYPQICAMEHALIRVLLGTQVRRTEYRLTGDPRCTYTVSPRSAPPASEDDTHQSDAQQFA